MSVSVRALALVVFLAAFSGLGAVFAPKAGAQELLVNTTRFGAQFQPDVAALQGGGFVVVWRDDSLTGGDTSGSAIRAQRYGADRSPAGAEFLVNTTTQNGQIEPSVAALPGGGFVIVWSDSSATGGDTSGSAIRAQRYGADGSPAGAEFLVNKTTQNGQVQPSIAALNSGGFVIAWRDDSLTGGDPSNSVIRAQRFGADGSPAESEFLVNTTTQNGQFQPSIAALANGGFVIVWSDTSATGGDTSLSAVRAQRYGADGSPAGSEFLVNTTTQSWQWEPSVAALTSGGFVIAWQDDSASGGDTWGSAVRAQRYGADGSPAGGEFLVNTNTQQDQREPSLAGLASGGFVIAWEDTSQNAGDESPSGIIARRYNADGSPAGGEFLANVTTLADQWEPAIAGLTSGGFVVAWRDDSASGGDTSGAAIRAQAFTVPDNTPPRIASIVRQTPPTSPTNADSVTWRVTFDEVVNYTPARAATSFGLTNADNVSDAGALELDGALSVTTAVVNGTTYLFAAGFVDDGVSVFSVADNGTLTNVFNVSDNAALELDGAISVTTAVVNGTTYLFAAGFSDSGVSVFSVANDGTLSNVFNVGDDATLELDGARSVTTAVVDGTTYLFAAGFVDDGVSVFSVADNGTLTNVFNVADDATLQLAGAHSVTTAVVNGTTYLFVAGQNDDGVSVFSVANNGALTNVFNVSDNATLELEGARSVTTAVVDSTTYLFAAGVIDDGVSVFSVANNGTLTNVANVADTTTLELDGANSVTTAVVNGATYLFAAGVIDDGISVFSVASDGTLTNVTNVADDAMLELEGAFSVTTAVVGGMTYLFVAGFDDDGVSVFSVTPEAAEVTNFTLAGTTGSLTETVISSTQIDVTASGGDLANLDATITLGFAAGQTFADTGGNALVNTTPTGTNDNSFVIDNTAPTLAITGPAGTVSAAFTATFTFSEDVDGFAEGDIAVGNGAATNVQTVSGSVYTATITPAADGPVTVDVAGSAATDTAGNDNTAATQFSVTFATPPRVSQIIRDTPAVSPTNTDSLTWAVSFNIDVTNVSADDFTVSGTTATLGVIRDNAQSYRVTASGGDLASFNGTVTLGFAPGQNIQSTAGAALVDTSVTGANQPSYVLDNTAPTVSITGPAGPVQGAFTAIITFSEAVSGFVSGDVTLSNATLLSFNGSGTTYTVNVQPSADGTVAIDVGGGVATDSVGNGNTAATQYSVVRDFTRPGLTISGPAGPVNGAFTATFTFTEAVTGFTVDDIFAFGSTLSNFAGSGAVYTVTVTPGAISSASVEVPQGLAQDAAGNTNTASNTFAVSVDTTAPTLTAFARNTPAGEKTNADTLVFDISFNEAVVNVTVDDFTITGTTATGALAGSGSDYTLTLSGGNLASLDGTVGLNLAAGQNITDAAGNALPAAEPGTDQTYDVRNTAPALTSITRFTPSTSPTNADSLVWQLNFGSIDTFFTLPANAFTVSGTTATVTNVQRFSIGLYVTVSGGDLANLNGDVTLGLANTDFADDYGNVMDRTIPAGAELTYTVDNTAPTLTITGPDGLVSGTFTATFTFSEDVTGFAVGDITVGNGAASNFQAVSGSVYTATITPAGDGAVNVDVASAAATDAAGNGNSAAAQFSVTADVTAPALLSFTRLTPSTEQTDADSLVFQAAFSESVGNVSAEDFVVTGTTATVSSVTAIPPPDPDLSSSAAIGFSTLHVIEVSGGDLANINAVVGLDVAPGQDIADLAGNPFAGGEPAIDETYTVQNDIIAPRIVSIERVSPTSAITAADSVTWRMTFDEPVQNVSSGDFALTGSTAGLAVNNVSTTITDITASGGDLATLTATVSLGLSGAQDITDAVGNALVNPAPTGANDNSFIIDNTGPTATILAPSGFDTLDPFVVTVTFDEPVLFFTDLGEVTATNATVTAPSGSGDTYTVTVTPNGEGDVEIGVLAQAVLDLTLVNYNAAPAPVTVQRDATPPAVALASTASDPAAGDIIVSASFSEAVSGLTQDDFVITNGSASNFQQLTPSIYFVRVTPTADGLVSVGLPAGAADDRVGNASLAATDYSVTADNTRPVPRFVNAPTAINSTAPFNVTVEFSEPVFFFTDIGEVAAFNASVSAPVGTGTTYNVTVTPDSGGDIYLAVIEGAALDATFVNSNTPISTVIRFDDRDPRLAAVERLDPLTETTNADALTWRASFDEDVTSVDAADFALTGTSGAVTSVTGSGNTYEVTASGGDLGFMDGTVSLGLAASASIADTAGNSLTNIAPTGTVESYTLKNSAPALVIATSTAPPVLEAFPVSFTFSEAVTGFTLSDISASNATMSGFQPVSATSYTAIATPTADGTITISVAAFAAEDALNNGNTAASLSIESRAINPPAGTISAIVAPGARSGYIGGPQLTASAFVANTGTNPVADCSVLIPPSAPVTMSWQQVDGALNPVGAPGDTFDLPVGASASLILTLTPTSVTPLTGYTMYPQFLCRNASADPITGVNTLFLAISATPPPDILSSGATVSGDGVVRIPSAGSVGFLSAAAVNIGGGDDSAGLNDVTVTVTADTGSISIPVTLDVCETHPVTGVCLAPRSASTTATWSQNENRFFAVFVRDASGGAGIPLDAANSRVYLRFTDATGTLRSITSAAVTAPAAAGVTPPLSALPTGRWSVLVREADGVWPSLTPSVLHVGPDGLAILDDGNSPRAITITPMTSETGPISQFGSGGATGFWHAAGVIRQGDALASDAGDFWGARDVRSDTALNWADLAGDYGNGVFITEAGEIRGHIGGCAIYGQASGTAARPVLLTLSGCDISGRYTGVLDLPANDTDTPALLVAAQNRGWRLER